MTLLSADTPLGDVRIINGPAQGITGGGAQSIGVIPVGSINGILRKIEIRVNRKAALGIENFVLRNAAGAALHEWNCRLQDGAVQDLQPYELTPPSNIHVEPGFYLEGNVFATTGTPVVDIYWMIQPDSIDEDKAMPLVGRGDDPGHVECILASRRYQAVGQLLDRIYNQGGLPKFPWQGIDKPRDH